MTQIARNRTFESICAICSFGGHNLWDKDFGAYNFVSSQLFGPIILCHHTFEWPKTKHHAHFVVAHHMLWPVTRSFSRHSHVHTCLSRTLHAICTYISCASTRFTCIHTHITCSHTYHTQMHTSHHMSHAHSHVLLHVTRKHTLVTRIIVRMTCVITHFTWHHTLLAQVFCASCML